MRNDLPAHAKYGPSSMARIMACPASVTLQEQAPPQKESPYAAEGTRAHNLGEAMLMEDALAIHEALKACEEAGDDMDEVKAAVEVYVNHCNQYIDEADAYGIEAKVVLTDEIFGTADCYFLHNGVLHVVDYKHGAGVTVSAENNKQALSYAALILHDDAININREDVKSLALTIVQPRGQGMPVSTWVCGLEDVEEHYANMMAAVRASKAAAPHAELGEHCKFCTAKLICPAMKAAERGVAEWDQRDLSPEELQQMLTDAKALEEKIKALFTYAYDRIEAGDNIPGWKLTAGRKSRVWEDEAALVRWAKRNGKMNILFKKSLLSPAQAAKVVSTESLEPFIGYKESKPSLKPESAPGEPVLNAGSALAALGKRLSS